jgi:hypothetical protein
VSAIKYKTLLSTTEPNHQIFLRFRQDDTQTQTLSVEITANGRLFPFVGYTVEFVNITRSDSGQPIVEKVESVYPENARIEFTLGARSLQWLGKNVAYFSFKDSTGNEVFSTHNFEYEVVRGVHKEPILDSGYLWQVDEIIEKIKIYFAENKANWEKFIEDNRAILESIDPGGTILGILNDAKGDFPNLAKRLNQKFQVPVGASQIRTDNRFFNYDTMRYETLVPKKLEEVIASVDDSKFNMAFITDIHLDNHNLRVDGGAAGPHTPDKQFYLRHWRAIPQFQRLGNKTDVMIYGGDNIDGGLGSMGDGTLIRDEWGARHSMLATLKRFTSAACTGQEKPVIICQGNHDRCFDPLWRRKKGTLSTADFAEYWNGTYGGVLFEDKKIAVYRLNTDDFYEGGDGDNYIDGYTDTEPGVISGQQLLDFGNWLVELPRDYHLIIVGHVPLFLDKKFVVRNVAMVSTLLEGFKSGSAVTLNWNNLGAPNDGRFSGTQTFDMSQKGAGVVVGYFCGHWHEFQEYNIGTVKMILCDVGFTQTTSLIDTAGELGFYKIEVDTALKKVTMLGVGHAKDFTYNY